ncbi:ABC transporter substrate-binding protein [Nonomuraea sp. GTA35]|uniref:ABC transporter substrate-binding protein n=1 Tax=Nonomuraea sp. GTA35 TaxID=1676746 RepID=UPI0035C1620D
MDKAVDLFNRTHKDIHVTLDNIPPGNRGGHGKMHAAVMSGDAPCLVQMEFQELPSFLLNSELVDLGPYLTQADRAEFQQGTWDLVAFEGGTYAVPQATGPVALYNREDLLKKWDIKVPTTWQEYREAAIKIRKADPGGQASAGYGGSATSLLRGCEHPEEAVEFALWINRDPRSVETLIKSGYGWPAAISGMSNPQLTKPSAFLGGQQTAQLFTDSSNQVPKGWVRWPTFDDTVKILSDRFEKALGGRSTLVDALKAAERRTVEQIRTKGLRAE